MDTASYITGYHDMLEKAALVFGGAAPVSASAVKDHGGKRYVRVTPDYIQQMLPLQKMKFEQDRKVNEANHWYTRLWHQFGQWNTDRKYNKGMQAIADNIAKSSPVDERRMRAVMATNPNAQFLEFNEEAFDPSNAKNLGKSINEALTAGDEGWAMTEGLRRAGSGFQVPQKPAPKPAPAPAPARSLVAQPQQQPVRTGDEATRQFVAMMQAKNRQPRLDQRNLQYALQAQQLGFDPAQTRQILQGRYRRDAKGNIRTDLV